jgi:hypothetical protein
MINDDQAKGDFIHENGGMHLHMFFGKQFLDRNGKLMDERETLSRSIP